MAGYSVIAPAFVDSLVVLACQLCFPLMCRFRGYYERPFITIDGQTFDNPRKYQFSTAYWHILASKLFFVLAFLVSLDAVELHLISSS